MPAEFTTQTWNPALEDDCRALIRLAIREDLDRTYDWTTVALVPTEARGKANVAAREAGVVAGVQVAQLVIAEMQLDVTWKSLLHDGDDVAAGQALAELEGSARDLLTGERIMLNFLGRLSGIASLTKQYVAAIAGTSARIYDTRKTTPAWRRAEKYAVHCGGGWNHRTGLFDAVLIKDNHLALAAQCATAPARTPAEAITATREFLRTMFPDPLTAAAMIVEIEVDTLAQFEQVLPQQPNIILLDNMSLADLRTAVALRNAAASTVQLEASGGVNLTTVHDIAATGVDRISVGALTHSARVLDIGLDWL
jgi:nicotinate-nucleotide pyrophosphorylase (carboxylating)